LFNTHTHKLAQERGISGRRRDSHCFPSPSNHQHFTTPPRHRHPHQLWWQPHFLMRPLCSSVLPTTPSRPSPPPPLRMCVSVCAGCCLIVIVLLPKSASLPTPLPAALSDLNFIIYRYIFIYETIQWGKMRKNKTLKV